MMDASKIRLSGYEMELVKNAELILTKNRILEKIRYLFESLAEKQQEWCRTENFSVPGILGVPPRISRGEKYRGLPWLVLDYPRLFLREHVCAIRTLFWWGHFFSITLQLSGKYKILLEKNMMNAYPRVVEEGWICVNENPWEHHFEETNYIPLNSCSQEEFNSLIREKSFIKLAFRLPLSLLEETREELGDKYRLFLEILQEKGEIDQFPRR